MSFQDKLLQLRKSSWMSQEVLAEKLNVSRQAVSRWESGTAMPDAGNLLQLSDLFGVTVDELLRGDNVLEQRRAQRQVSNNKALDTAFIVVIALEVMALILQVISAFVLQSVFFTLLSFLPFVAAVAGFEWAFRRYPRSGSEIIAIRRKFYVLTAWLGSYFPVRLVICFAAFFYPRPYSTLVPEIMILLCYLILAGTATALLNRKMK